MSMTQTEFDSTGDMVQSAMEAIYANLVEDGYSRAEIDAIFENKYDIHNATEDFGND